jgi:ribosomal protein S18 acetylase RimI-like enzyme
MRLESTGRADGIPLESERPMIRPTEPTDTPALVAAARGTGVFKPHEITALEEVLDDYHAKERANGHRAITLVQDGQAAGFAYYAPSSMSERGWYLWWIVVERNLQGQGLGRALSRHAEEEIQARSGRILFIETSSSAPYEPTRRFYSGQGYEQAAVIRDFYADGDDLVVFAKRLERSSP